MNWVQYRIQATHEQSEPLEDALCAAGAVSITYADAADKPIFEPEIGAMPLWPDIELVGLFPADIDTSDAEETISRNVSFSLPAPNWELLEDRLWEREWLKHFKPLCFAEKLWVTPQDMEIPNQSDGQLAIYLDPGLAFGTGTHPTTALCLEWIAQQNWQSKTILDYGCGSGILAIAALKLGCENAFAIDIDPQAIEATLENARRNSIEKTRLSVGLPGALNSPACSAVIANILAQPLLDLSEDISTLVIPGGQLCLSGITVDQADAVAAVYSPWFEEIQVRSNDGWSQISARKRGGSA